MLTKPIKSFDFRFLTLISTSYKIYNLKSTPGIYYDKLGPLKIYENTWNLVTYMDLTYLDKKISLIQNKLHETQAICNNHTRNTCQNSLLTLNSLASELQRTSTDLKNFLGSPRVKRAWFDGIGSMFRTITGNLDQNDALYYDEMISKIQNDEHQLSQLIKAQVQVVSTTITNFNESITNFQKNKEILDQNFKKMEGFMNVSPKNLCELELTEIIESHFSYLSLLFTETRNELSTIINAVLFAKNNVLHPRIIEPTKLIKELKSTITHIPIGCHYPYLLSDSNINSFLKICTLKAFFMNNRLVFTINIPLVRDTNFVLYNLIPFPSLADSHDYVFIQPEYKYLTMSDTQSQYSFFQDFNHCILTNEASYVCKFTYPLYSSFPPTPCEVQLLSGITTIPNNCDTRIAKINNEAWYKLTNKNLWIYLLPLARSVSIMCQNSEIADITMNGTGILELDSHCKAYTPSTLLAAEDSFNSNYSVNLLPIEISKDDCCDKIHFNSSVNPIILDTPKFEINLNNLNVASHKLSIISRKIDDIKNDKVIARKVSIFTYIGYAVSIIFILWIILKCWLCTKKRRSLLDHTSSINTHGGFDNLLLLIKPKHRDK